MNLWALYRICEYDQYIKFDIIYFMIGYISYFFEYDLNRELAKSLQASAQMRL